MYTCPRCYESQFTEVKKLIWHLREIHALSEGLDFTLICSQDGCPRTYHSIKSFTKHLYRDHQTTSTMVDSESFQTRHRRSTEAGMSANEEPLANEEPPAMPSVALKAMSASDNAASFVAQMYSASNVTLIDVTISVTCGKELYYDDVET